MYVFLLSKLSESNAKYSTVKKMGSNVVVDMDYYIRSLRRWYKKISHGGNNGFNKKDTSDGSKP